MRFASFSGFVEGPRGAALRGRTPIRKVSFNKPAGLFLLYVFFRPMTSALKICAEKAMLLVELSQRIHWLWSSPMLKA